MKTLLNKPRNVAGVGLAAAALVACSANVDTTDVAPSISTERAGSATGDAHPDPVASFDVGSDHRVEFYEFRGGEVLVMETGKAGGTIALANYGPMIRSVELVNLFKSLRPDLPVPSALIDLQSRAKAKNTAALSARPYLTQNVPTALGTSHAGGGGPLGGGQEGKLQPDTSGSCGNSCCDYAWLTGYMCYWYGGYGNPNVDYSWFDYDWGWSSVSSTGVNQWQGAACSASGTSQFNVSISDGDGGSWSIPEGYYIYYSWGLDYDCCDTDNARSSVNSESNEHLHTYCGAVNY